jgi:trans-aconitate 2-methyltransferase
MTSELPAGCCYTFGDTDIAARRLSLLDQVFGPASRALLTEVVRRPPSLAYDLGCGPGHTTAMIAEVTAAGRTVGLDRSPAYVARARSGAPDRIEFACHDVRTVPFPAGPADLIYGRLLLAHLADPVAAVLGWATQLARGGLVVLDEIEWIDATNPVLRAHLKLADALVAAGGARMQAGPLLSSLPGDGRLRLRLARITEVPVPTATAAAMFSMNLAAIGERPAELGLCGTAELRELRDSLAELTTSPAAGQISWGMHQAAYSRAG